MIRARGDGAFSGAPKGQHSLSRGVDALVRRSAGCYRREVAEVSGITVEGGIETVTRPRHVGPLRREAVRATTLRPVGRVVTRFPRSDRRRWNGRGAEDGYFAWLKRRKAWGSTPQSRTRFSRRHRLRCGLVRCSKLHYTQGVRLGGGAESGYFDLASTLGAIPSAVAFPCQSTLGYRGEEDGYFAF